MNFSLTCTLNAGETYYFSARHFGSNNDPFTVMLITNHDYAVEINTEVTCTQDGLETFTCQLCGESYTEVIPAIGNSYVDDVCRNCGERLNDPDSVFPCNDGDLIILYNENYGAVGYYEDEYGNINTAPTVLSLRNTIRRRRAPSLG